MRILNICVGVFHLIAFGFWTAPCYAQGVSQEAKFATSPVFAVRINAEGEVSTVNNIKEFVFPGRPRRAASLVEAWKEYYSGLLGGNEEVRKKFQAGTYPIVSRESGQEAELTIVTVSELGGSVRVIVIARFGQPNNGNLIIYDCHVWKEIEPETWKVTSLLREES